jgi:MFS family permease
MQDAHDPYAALRHRDYRMLLMGNVLAALSVEVQATVVSWELWERTHSEANLGYAGLAQFLPVLLLALPAGQAADRFSRKHLLLVAYLTILLTSLGLAAVSWFEAPVELLFGCLVLAGCSRALSMPVRASLVALVVPTEKLANAVSWNSSGWQIANVAGPAVGGLIIAETRTPALAYVLTGSGLLICLALVSTIQPRRIERQVESRSLASLLSGIRFVWKSELLLAAITLDLFAVLLGGATALLPVFASSEYLDIGPTGFGWLRAAPAFGAFVTALLLAHRPPMQRPGLALLGAVVGFGVATIIFGISTNPYLSFFMLLLTGALDNISVVVRGTLMQVLTPDAMRGRVAAVNAVFISSSNELGAFESGITADWFGPVLSVVGGGFGTLLVVAAVMYRWPRLAQLGPLHSLLQSPSAGAGPSA